LLLQHVLPSGQGTSVHSSINHQGNYYVIYV
jgi:hypothetical protein